MITTVMILTNCCFINMTVVNCDSVVSITVDLT